jgi:tRNA1Val (adenine37-N6)-methyltransferase
MDETLDSLPFGSLQLFQARSGYRYSLDPVLLARFIKHKKWQTVIDLGTGCGILPMVLARLGLSENLVGIELQTTLVQRAEKNVELNDLQKHIAIHQGDVRQVEQTYPAGIADLVVSNPPYRQLNSGQIAPDDERACARHEVAGGLNDFVGAAAWLLKYGGVFSLVHLAERLPEISGALIRHGLEPKRLRFVHPHSGDAARMVLIEAKKGGKAGVTVEPPLLVYRDYGCDRKYTQEVLEMYEL